MVEPGQEVRIPVSFLTEGFPGKQRKVVKLFSNDPDQPVVTMTLRGTVEAPLVVEPRQLIFGDIVRGSEQSLLREVSVRVADGVSGAISSVVVPDSLVVSNEERGARSWRAQIRPLQELKGGDLREQITIVWDGGRHVIPVFGVVQGRVSLSPMAVAFGVVDDEAVKVRSATLLVRGGERVQVTNVRGSHPAISGRAVPEIDGYRYRIEITLDPTKLTGDLRGSLTVHTGGSDNGRYTLGVFSVLPPRVD